MMGYKEDLTVQLRFSLHWKQDVAYGGLLKEDLTVQFDKSMFLLALNTDGVCQMVHGCLSWQRKGRLPLFEVLMISCDIFVDKPVSTIIISIAYIVIIIIIMILLMRTIMLTHPCLQ